MPRPLVFDFVAPAGSHLGIVQTIEEQIAAIPACIDRWSMTQGSRTLVSGAVSEWVGVNGRIMGQTGAENRPVISADGKSLNMGDGAGGSKAVLSLSGAQIGEATALTVAMRCALNTGALTVDQHSLLGMSQPTIWRLMHRYANANNYFRLDGSGALLDADIPAGLAGPLDIIITRGASEVVAGEYDVALHVGDLSSTMRVATAPVLTSFSIGGDRPTVPDWPGTISKLGIWRAKVGDAHLATIKSWLAS